MTHAVKIHILLLKTSTEYVCIKRNRGSKMAVSAKKKAKDILKKSVLMNNITPCFYGSDNIDR